MSKIESFFTELDARWAHPESGRLRLRVIGSAALMLQTGYERGTRDSDILETDDLENGIGPRLLDIAGEGTRMHRRHRMYLDIVARGLPFLPWPPAWHPVTELNRSLEHLELEVLDVVDVVVSKLRRFHPADISDIEAMVDLGRIPHDQLIDRFQRAVESFTMDARAPDLPKIVSNFNRVERDLLGVAESEIDLPGWLAT